MATADGGCFMFGVFELFVVMCQRPNSQTNKHLVGVRTKRTWAASGVSIVRMI